MPHQVTLLSYFSFQDKQFPHVKLPSRKAKPKMGMAFCLPVFVFTGIAFDTNTLCPFQPVKHLEHFYCTLKTQKMLVKYCLGSGE